MTNIVIAGYARSPFTQAGKGALARVRPDDLTAQVIRGLIERTGVDASEIEDIILGCAFPEGEQGMNVARLIGLLADLPLSVGGMTVNRFCGSSMSAIHIAMGQIQIGAGEAFICAGIESMSRVPMGGYNPLPNPELAAARPGPIWAWVRPPRMSRPSTRSPAPSRKSSRSPARKRPPRRAPPVVWPMRSCRSTPRRAM
ncbi:hypothetical protein GCM10020258_49110 [Sphingomonas yabuuchiae]